MIRIAAVIIIVMSPICGLAQQHAIYSQYLFNLYAINPAYAGELDALAASLSYRSQWVGFEGAPRTQNFNIHSPINKKNMALGLQVQNDEIGARSTPGISAAYSYKVRLSPKSKLSFGIQAGVINYQYDWNKLEYNQTADPVAFGASRNEWIPSFDFGVMYTTKDAYVGLSALGLNNPKTVEGVSSDARLETFFNLVAGKLFKLSSRLALKPSALIRKSLNSPYQFDFNFSARYLNRYWITATYRYGFGMVASAHFFVTDRFHLGYAYDLPVNPLLAEQSGTHEIFIGYNFSIYGKRNSD